ncbi:MAG: pro-sigmaK processing inhibitor BofA family protein [Defluviitaleaceae bacterium]|nr:pro-sigmaK processing inhibitor BofA family protein [Defluviitaleaceae bacterium]
MENSILILGAIGILLAIGILVITGRFRKAINIILRGVLGIAAIFGINWGLTAMGIYIATPGINALTVSTIAFLGLPGLVSIYGLAFFS